MISYSFEEGDQIYAPMYQVGDVAAAFIAAIAVAPTDSERLRYSPRLMQFYDKECSHLPEWAFERVKAAISSMHKTLESHIEVIALAKMLSTNVSTGPSPRYPVAMKERQAGDFVTITPQVKLEKYRADFVVDTPHGPSFLVECDGKDFHDDDKDRDRDIWIYQTYDMHTLRVTGKEIWNTDAWLLDFSSLARGKGFHPGRREL